MTTLPMWGESAMSGHQEQWGRLEASDLPDPPDATQIMARPFGHGQEQADEHARTQSRGGNGNGAAAAPEPVSRLAAESIAGRHRTTHSPGSGTAEPSPEPEPQLGSARQLPEPTAADRTERSAADAGEPATAGQAAARASEPEFKQVESVAGTGPLAGTEPGWSPGQADRTVVRPEPGSWADLRQRLERLPHGHPSSPYHVDGERKPPPPRLRHLELAPPTRDRIGLPGINASEAGLPASPWPDDEGQPVTPAGDAPVAARGEQFATPVPDGAVDAHEDEQTDASQIPNVVQDEPRGTRVGGHDEDGHPFTPAARSHREPASDLPPTSIGRNEASLGRGPERAASPPRGFGSPRTGQSAPRTAPDESWTRSPAALTPDQVRVAEDAYDRFRSAEGRNLFGGYGSSGLTAMLRRVEERLEHGGLAPDTEQRALLEPDVFRTRFADMLRRYPERTPEQLARRVPGALCYAFIFDTEHYADGIRLVQEALEIQGFRLQARKNGWSSAVNRCVFTVWHDPLSDLPFQVQFHTRASLEAQKLMRTSATLINDPRIPSTEAAGLRSELAAAWAALPAPPGSMEIGDYRRDGSNGRSR